MPDAGDAQLPLSGRGPYRHKAAAEAFGNLLSAFVLVSE
jgi:hypothetical protein